MTYLIAFIVCFIAGIGAGLGTGFAGMSAAAVISPMLITFLGMDPYMAARLLGHSDLKMLTKIYDHTSPETLRQALLKAGNQGAPPGGAPAL